MNHYGMEDFLAYYKGSWLLHPHRNVVLRIVGVDTADPQNRVLVQDLTQADANMESLRLDELDWQHVSTPTLGYRGFKGGQRLYYLMRRARRQAAKGVNPSAVVVRTPAVISQIASHFGAGDRVVEMEGNLENIDVARSLWNPVFTPFAAAIDGLTTDPLAIGYALSNNWAMTLGLYKEEPLLLHFKDMRVASSVDGGKWTFYNPTSEALFEDNNVRGL